MVDVASRRTLCTLVAAAFIDGKFDKTERDVVYRKGKNLGIPVEMIDEIVELGKKGALAVSVPPTQKQKEDLLNDLIDVVCADGRLEPAENHLLMKFASQMGITVHDLGERVRRQMGQARRPTPVRDEVVIVEDAPPVPKRKTPVRQPDVLPPRRPEVVLEAVMPVISPSKPIPPDQPVGNIEPSADIVKPLPPGPIRLAPPSLGGGSLEAELGAITLQLVKQTLSFEGPEKARAYLEQSCGISDPAKVERILEELLRPRS